MERGEKIPNDALGFATHAVYAVVPIKLVAQELLKETLALA